MEEIPQTTGKKGKNKLRIAAYMRLSKTDGRVREESNSISMQRILIRKYIAIHFGTCEVSEYQDDGFSGTNFNRPGVKRLLEDAANEKVDCIVVKDFSRFGRDYMEVGAYLEQIFPFLGIRFISINDHYDSALGRGKVPDFDVNFKNLLYDFYSKDISQKVKASLQARKEGGRYVSANAPFGYEKAPDDRHMLVICEEEAAVVREIFSLALQGMTSSQTAKRLNREHVPTPIEFKIKKGKTSRKPKGERFFWSGSTVCSILRNPVYAGDVEYGKTEKEQVGGRSVRKERKDWHIIRNHHAPVITREDFEKVQENRGTSRKREAGADRHPLTGRVVCGCCRCSLRLRDGKNPYFTCQNRYVNGQEDCVRKVRAAVVEQAAAAALEKNLEMYGLKEEGMHRAMGELQKNKQKLLQQMRRAEREYDRLKQEHFARYHSYSQGQQAEFHPLYAEMEKQCEVLRDLQEASARSEEQLPNAESGKPVSGYAALTPELVERCIDKIVVYSEDKIEVRCNNMT